jgi:GAF domain-containing protein
MAEDPHPLPPEVTTPRYGPEGRPAGIAFADMAQEELDRLLGQLAERVHRAQRTESRLRRLLRANLEVARAVDLDEILGRTVAAAADLVDARYGSLGVLEQGHRTRFVHAGPPPEVTAGIGRLLPDIARHPAPVAVPACHPLARSHLGVPIRVRERAFGDLYLTAKPGGGFTREDEDLVSALAAAAGVAIEHATRFAASRRDRDWHAALVNVDTELLSGTDPGQAMRYLVRQVCHASGADGAGFTTVTDDPAWLRTVVGLDLLAPWEGVSTPVEGSLSGHVIAERRPVLIEDAATDPRTAERAALQPRIGAIMAAPVIGERGVRGVLLACRRKGDRSFDAGELGMIATFAAQAALALELAEARRNSLRLQLLEERQRIAGDLRDTVIHDLFSLGLSLQCVASRTADPALRDAIGVGVGELDRIIRVVREAIFAVDPTADRHEAGDRPA